MSAIKHRKVLYRDRPINIPVNNPPKQISTVDKHRDIDGDGIPDFIDSSYTTTDDKYRYRELNEREYDLLKQSEYARDCQCRDSRYIMRYSPDNEQRIDEIIKPSMLISATAKATG